MSKLPYVYFDAATFLQEVGYLTMHERGVYLSLLFLYWTLGGPITNKSGRLYKQLGISEQEWLEVVPVLSDFFEIKDDVWTHLELEEKFKEIEHKRKKLSKAGKESQKRQKAYAASQTQQGFSSKCSTEDTSCVELIEENRKEKNRKENNTPPTPSQEVELDGDVCVSSFPKDFLPPEPVNPVPGGRVEPVLPPLTAEQEAFRLAVKSVIRDNATFHVVPSWVDYWVNTGWQNEKAQYSMLKEAQVLDCWVRAWASAIKANTDNQNWVVKAFLGNLQKETQPKAAPVQRSSGAVPGSVVTTLQPVWLRLWHELVEMPPDTTLFHVSSGNVYQRGKLTFEYDKDARVQMQHNYVCLDDIGDEVDWGMLRTAEQLERVKARR